MSSNGNENIYRFGEFELIAERRVLLKNGEVLAMSAKSFDLLQTLVENRDSVVTKDELLTRVWPDQFVEENNLTVQISALRKVFGERKGENSFIATIPGKGYRFVADVRELDEETEIIIENRTVERITITDDTDRPDTGPKLLPAKRTNYLVVVSAGIVLVAAVLGILLVYLKFTADPTNIESIAVMPFTYQGDTEESEYLSDGVTESLINNLSQLPKLSVKARSTVFQFKEKAFDPQSVGRQLNVQAVLLGKIVENGDDLAFSLELVNAATGDQIWGERYERKRSNIATLSNEIAHDVVSKLKLRLGSEPIALGQTKDSVAYDLYLRGRYLWNKRRKPDHERALQLFQQAIERDPNFALGYAAIGDVYSIDSSPLPREQSVPLAWEALSKALALEPRLGEAYASEGNLEWDAHHWNDADESYKKAIDLNPNYAEAHHWRAELLTRMGRHDEAIAEMKVALKIDPLSQVINNDYAYVLTMARHYEDGLAQARVSNEMNKEWGLDHIIYALEYLDRYDDALDASRDHPYDGSKDADSIARFNKDIEFVRARFRKEGPLGYWSGWLEITEKYIKSGKKGMFVFAAVCYVKIGRFKEALDSIEKAVDNRELGSDLLMAEPHFDPIRGEARYQALLKKVGLDNALQEIKR